MISQYRQAQVDYERRRMAYHDAISLRRDSWLEGFEEGLRLGFKAGLRLGIEEGMRLGIDEGKRIALVELLIEKLDSRGLMLSEAQRECIKMATDLAWLKYCFRKASQASSVEWLFDS